ncbi:exportin-5 isoform X3 [Pelobates cultripes]|uniref:Exportin-5 n=4 Tax=Pelobates cultripes TaxID=61616 RepID=A0AAD1VUQ7_PELCU|nr:exportin-5 isoform X3 [Pelobates cultripes]
MFQFCEDFKENCPLCVPCGLKLAEKMQLPVVRHFGLQVLEHVIKFRWNNMSSEDKLCLKYSVMELISNGMNTVLEEEAHIKDVFARIIVEMIKREWPQNWPDMLNELEALTKQGEVQTELVMFILLRLAEDVVTFHTLPPQRRRDIHLTMMQNMDKLFAFMLNILQENVTQYQHLNDTGQKGQSLSRVAVAALNTLAGYMDWVPIAHIVADNCKLLEGLCVLLSEPELQVEAAECLLIAVSRKGKLEDREPLMILFEDSAMNSILSAAQMADVEGLVEKSYIFLKRLCQVLCALGNQICALTVVTDPHAKVPVNFGKYLDALLAFTRHPSLFLKSSTLMTWGSLYRHELLSKDPQLLAAIPKFLQISMTSVVKVGFPSKNDSPSCEYSRLDFDCDEDFNTSYSMFLSWMTNILKAVCRLDPHTSFHMAGNWLRFLLTAPVDEEPQTFNPGKASGSPLSSTQAQWEAMTFFSEGITRVAFGVLCEEEGRVAEGIDLLHSILAYEATDPVILSCVLTNLSSYFPFIRYTNPSMPLVLSKLFAAISFHTSANSKDPLTRAVKNVRRHACCSLIKICSTYPELVLPHFELLYTQVKHLLKDERFQSQMERCSAMEALVLVSNQLKDYEKQKSFLMEFISPLMSVWLSEDVQRAISSPEAFISFVGAAASTNVDIEEDPCRLNRTQLSFCSFGILRMIMRAHWPSDIEEAKTGGFLVGYTPTGTPIFRHPCSEAVLKLVDSVVALIRTHNGIYHPDVLAKMGALSKAVEIMEIEKRSILGLPPLEASDTPFRRNLLERLQGFFCSSYDNCYQILGGCGPSLQQDFYSIPNLVPHLLNSAFTNLDNVPDFRLRVMLRRFVKPFILSCPPERYGSIVIPILGPLLNYMQQRLSQKWLFVNQQDIVSEEDECKEESVEILEDLLLRLLSREVMDLIIVCCVAKKNQSPSNAGADGLISATQVEVEDEEMMASDTTNPGTVELTELGRFLMGNEDLSTVLLVTVFSPLVWKDTISCQKAAVLLCWPLLTQVISSSLPSDAAVCFFTNVLRGLQMHGQHEGCLSALVHLAFQIYEALRPHYPALRSVMEQVPEIQKQSLDQFDSKLLFPKQKMADKRRKDHFKRLITGCIGKPLGEQFRKEIHIRNLPALFQKKSKTQLDVDPILENCDDSLPALFKP